MHVWLLQHQKRNPPARFLKTLPHVFRDAFTWHLLFINVLEDDSIFNLFRPGFNWILSETHLVGVEPFLLILFGGHCTSHLILSSQNCKEWEGKAHLEAVNPDRWYSLVSIHCISHLSSDNCKEFTWEVVNPDRWRQEVKAQSDQGDNWELRDTVHNPRSTILDLIRELRDSAQSTVHNPRSTI